MGGGGWCDGGKRVLDNNKTDFAIKKGLLKIVWGPEDTNPELGVNVDFDVGT